MIDLASAKDFEITAEIGRVLAENNFGVKSMAVSGTYNDYDGKKRRHFNVEVVVDLPDGEQ
jgi:hypothetical protein